jgi:hypothetical protein
MTIKLPAGLMRGWRRLFRALWREGYPDGGARELAGAWRRFLTALPAALFRQRSLFGPDPALVLVAEWLTAEHVAATARAAGLVALYRPLPWGVELDWSDAEGNCVNAIDSDHN